MKPAPTRYVNGTIQIGNKAFMILSKKKTSKKKKLFDLTELCNVEGRSGFTFGEKFSCSAKKLNKLTKE